MFLDTPDPADVVVPVPGIQHAVAIDFDPVDKFIYWSDVEAFWNLSENGWNRYLLDVDVKFWRFFFMKHGC